MAAPRIVDERVVLDPGVEVPETDGPVGVLDCGLQPPPAFERTGVAVVGLFEPSLLLGGVGEVLEDGAGCLGLFVPEGMFLRELGDAQAPRPNEAGRLMREPAVARLETPRAEPFEVRIRRVVVTGRDHRFGSGEVVAPVVRRRSVRLLDEQSAHGADLVGRPQLVRVYLPQEALLADVRKRRGDHLSFPVPE